MQKKHALSLSILFFLTAFSSSPTLAQSFRYFVNLNLKNGFYFLVDKDTLSPSYAVTVEDGYVTADVSDGDEFGCIGRGCDAQMSKYAGKNSYAYINPVQLMRETPDGKRVVLSWFKDLDY